MCKKVFSRDGLMPGAVPTNRLEEKLKRERREVRASAERQEMCLVAMSGFGNRAGVVRMTRIYMEVVAKVAHGLCARRKGS